MNLNKILTIVFLLTSTYLAYRLYRGVQGTIEEKRLITTTEENVINRLKLIREAEHVFREVNKRYTSNWDSLIQFIENGRVPNVQRKEIIKQTGYGKEEITVTFDTLGYTSAKDRIFKKNFALLATDNGTFVNFKVKVGDRVLKNQKSYAIKIGDKIQEPPFSDEGIITNIASLSSGDPIKKGDIMVKYWDYTFNPNVDIKKISEVPGQDGLKFDIYTGKVDKNGVWVQVIEVKDPKPIDPKRKESNDSKGRKPLRFGSRIDVTISGNWESQ